MRADISRTRTQQRWRAGPAWLAAGLLLLATPSALAVRVDLNLPAVEKGTEGWYEATVINDGATAATVTEVRFDMNSDPDWTLNTGDAIPSTGWSVSGNDILWTGSQAVAPNSGFTFKVQADHNLGSYTSISSKVTATVDSVPIDSATWDARFLADKDSSLELTWDEPDAGTNDTRDGDFMYIEEDVSATALQESTTYTFRIHAWEFSNKSTQNNGTSELTVTIPAASGWTAVSAAGAGVNFGAASVSGSEPAGWTLTWDLTTQIQDQDAEALFQATSPSVPIGSAVMVPFRATFSPLTDDGDDPNLINEFVARVADASSGTIIKTIAVSSDDAEEEGPDGTTPGDMYLTSTDLEIVKDDHFGSGTQEVGLRFINLAIPKGSFITQAYLTFRAVAPDSPNTNSGTTNLTIHGQAADDPPTFSSTANDISSRSTTSNSVNWSPGTWSTGNDEDSPSIAAIVQEIVGRPGWASGNDMVFIITGTGSRSADSYDGTPATAPKLTVSYRPRRSILVQ